GADLLDDGLAELEAVADRPVGRVEERERRRALAIAETNGAGLLDVGERGTELLAHGLRGGSCRRQQCCQQQAARRYRKHAGHGLLPQCVAGTASPGTALDGTMSSGPSSCSAFNSPSHFATTAVASELPMTLVAERPMSRKVSMPMIINSPASGMPNCDSVEA